MFLACSVDNNLATRKFYKLFSGGQEKEICIIYEGAENPTYL